MVLISSLLFTVLIVEIVGRAVGFLPQRPSEAYIRLTQQVGRLPEPFSRRRHAEPGEFDMWIDFNAMGFRDARTDFPAGAYERRILAVGDSFATAWEVPLDQRWTEQMQRFRPAWAVLNVGMRNWGTDQTYLNLVNYPLQTQPDIVLLMFFTGNDVSDNNRPGLINPTWDAPRFEPISEPITGFESLRVVPWSGYKNPFDEPARLPFPQNVLAWLRLHVVTYRVLDQLRQLVQTRVADAFSAPEADPQAAGRAPAWWGVFEVSNTDLEWEKAWKITEALLQEMKAVSVQRGAQFMIVVVPYDPLVQPDTTLERVKALGLLDPARYDLWKPSRRLSAFAEANGIPLLDLAPGLIAFREVDRPGRALYYPKDGHFTPLGNCVVAALTVNWIEGRSVVEPETCLP